LECSRCEAREPIKQGKQGFVAAGKRAGLVCPGALADVFDIVLPPVSGTTSALFARAPFDSLLPASWRSDAALIALFIALVPVDLDGASSARPTVSPGKGMLWILALRCRLIPTGTLRSVDASITGARCLAHISQRNRNRHERRIPHSR
jgi:hypothetical protein